MPGMGTVVVCSLAVGYVCGSFLTAELVSKHVSGKSAFDVGMGNPGMANMGATYGTGWAAVTLAGDIAKTILAFVLARSLFPATADVAGTAAAVGATLGHVFPAWHRFHGGKGVATLVGAITGIYPIVVLLCFAVWVLVFLITHYVSLASMTAGCSFPIFAIIYSSMEWSRVKDVSMSFIVFSFVVAGLLLWSHRKNIERLKAGTESKIYVWRPHDSTAAKGPAEGGDTNAAGHDTGKTAGDR